MAVLLGSSVVFVASFFASLNEAVPLIGFVAFLLFSLFVTLRFREERRFSIALLFMFAMVSLFVVLKGYFPLGLNLQTIGISYVLFRSIQLMTDVGEGELQPKDFSIENLILFSISFLTFSAGPIQHYQHFCKSLQQSLSSRLSAINWQLVSQRALSGAVKLSIFTPLLSGTHSEIIVLQFPPALTVALACIVFLLYIYFSFSGYMDWVIALGTALNFEIPDNFDRPYEPRIFWISGANGILLFYVYNPIIRQVMPRSKISGIIGFFIIFFLLGYWHGADIRFAVFGLLLGALAAFTKLLQSIQWSGVFKASALSMLWPFSHAVNAGMSLGSLAVICIVTWPGYTLGDAILLLGGPIRITLIIVFACVIASAICLAAIVMEKLIIRIAAAKVSGTVLRFIPLHIILFLLCLFTYHSSAPEVAGTLVYYQRF